MHIKTGDVEAHRRDIGIRRTQQRIKHVLTERWYAWEDAWIVAQKDPEVDLTAEPGSSAYKPILHEVPVNCSENPNEMSLTRRSRKRLRAKNLLEWPPLRIEDKRVQSEGEDRCS